MVSITPPSVTPPSPVGRGAQSGFFDDPPDCITADNRRLPPPPSWSSDLRSPGRQLLSRAEFLEARRVAVQSQQQPPFLVVDSCLAPGELSHPAVAQQQESYPLAVAQQQESYPPAEAYPVEYPMAYPTVVGEEPEPPPVVAESRVVGESYSTE